MLTTCALRCTALYVVLPVSRSGKTKTLARPATGLPGRLAWPTEAIAAVSYCSGPSTGRSGSRSRTIRVASATFSTSDPLPEIPVLKLIIATRGSMPNIRADAALWMAMSARSSASGCGLMAQSP